MTEPRQKILIVGGGVAALEACLALRWDRSCDAEVTLLTASRNFTFRALSVLEPFGLSAAPQFAIAEVISDCVSEIVYDELSSIDVDAREATTASGSKLKFDVAIVATGGSPHSKLDSAIIVGAPGWMGRMSIVVAQVDAGLVARIVFVMPEGASWVLPLYELAMFTADRARGRLRDIDVELIIPDANPLAEFGEQASARVVDLLIESGVRLARNCRVVEYVDDVLTTDDGRTVNTGFVVALPEIRGNRIDGLEHDREGFLPVDGYGLVSGTDCIYAAGDITDFRIKHGGIASQQANIAVQAIVEGHGGDADDRASKFKLEGMLLSPHEPTFMHSVVGEHDTSLDALQPESFERITGKIFSKHLTARLTKLMVSHARVN